MRFHDGVSRVRAIAAAVVLLIALRIAAAAFLPLSFDEAYYWLWSKHLALSYYDHPPLIAYAIRLGTAVFGKTALGVRALPLLLSVATSWAVWRAGASLLNSEEGGALSCLFFNLTLMATVETMTATPDAPLMTAAALFVWALAKLEATRDGRWCLAAGLFCGLGLLSKYTALFLVLGAGTWLLFTPGGRRWIATPWPWAGAALAFALFAPAIVWNATHDWISFRFQFGRAGAGHFAPHYLVEFLAAQIALATPFIFALGAIGLAERGGRRPSLLLAFVTPSILFFTEHALHDRVQGNWPSFLYPALAIAAAGAALHANGSGWKSWFMRWSKLLALPTAALFLAVSYGQALFGFLPMRDPTARLLGSGFEPVAQKINALREETHAAAILTTNYAPTAWLAFYLPGHPSVIQANEPYRWLAAPRATSALLGRPLLYVAEPRHGEEEIITQNFSKIRLIAQLTRRRHGRAISDYDVYLVSGWRGRALGRITNAP